MPDSLGDEIERVMRQRGISYRAAQIRTGISPSALLRWKRGSRPRMAQIIQWAEGIGEPVEKWLKLAGYDPSVARHLFSARHNRIPPPPVQVQAAAQNAPDAATRVEILAEYVARPEWGLPIDRRILSGMTPEQKRMLIRVVEEMQGIHILDDERAA